MTTTRHIVATAVWLLLACPIVLAAELTGDEKVVASVLVTVMKNMNGDFIGNPSVSAESTTLRQCYDLHRYYMNESMIKMMATTNSDGRRTFESISVTCVYVDGGTWKNYFVGFWTAEGRYEPKSPIPGVTYPEWTR